MHLNLEDSGLYLAVLEDFSELLELQVGDSNVFGESSFLASFHSVVGRLVSHSFLKLKAFDLSIGRVDPLRGVSGVGADVLECNGEVDNVQVQVVKAEVSQTSLKCRSDVFGLVEGVPELGDNE